MADIGDRMLEYRARNKMSQKEFAEKCGISTQTVWTVETHQQTPSRMTIAKIELVIGKEEKE